MNKLQAVFIDRDGTIGGTGHFIHPRDFTLYSFSKEAIRLLKNSGVKVLAFTNQHRIARGEATELEFIQQFDSFGFDASYICPHPSDSGCECHKPRPGLLLKAANEHHLDLTRCAVIGDVGSTDMMAAHAVGAIKIIVKTGWGKDSLEIHRHKWGSVNPDYVATDLLDAARWLLANDTL